MIKKNGKLKKEDEAEGGLKLSSDTKYSGTEIIRS
jgi:hypothetical protein